MSDIKIVFIGRAQSGKTQVINRICSRAYQEEYNATFGADFDSTKFNDCKVGLWDTAGQKLFQSTLNYYRGAARGVFFVDLSSEISDAEIEYLLNEINNLKKCAPNSKIVLVGSKMDMVKEPKQLLTDIQERIRPKDDSIQFEAIITTSAKENLGIDKLKEVIFKPVLVVDEENKHVMNSYEQKKQEFFESIKHLPNSSQISIQNALTSFENNNLDLASFIQTCETHIKGKHPHIMRALFSLVAIALITTTVAMIGFGIGFAAGIWAGPGAFISALIGGNSAALSVTIISSSLGLLSGANTLFYKDARTNDAIQHLYNLHSNAK